MIRNNNQRIEVEGEGSVEHGYVMREGVVGLLGILQ